MSKIARDYLGKIGEGVANFNKPKFQEIYKTELGKWEENFAFREFVQRRRRTASYLINSKRENRLKEKK